MLQNSILQHLLFFCPYFLLRKIVPKKSPIYFFTFYPFSATTIEVLSPSILTQSSRVRAHVTRTLQGFYVFCCHKCHTSPSNQLNSTQLRPFFAISPSYLEKNSQISFPKQHVVWWKTSRRFVKNNTSFYEKQHVVLWETTRCLMKNITSFCEKQHVVLWETTRCLMRNNTLFDERHHVVLWKTTRRFVKNNTSFLHKNLW